MDMVFTLFLVALVAYAAFMQWLRHQRRMLIHRERIAAIEKGVELPPLEQEVHRGSWNVQRILLLAGLTRISIGLGLSVVLSAILVRDSALTAEIPQGIQWIGVGPIAIGLSHLIVFFVERKR